eukprot:UN01919
MATSSSKQRKIAIAFERKFGKPLSPKTAVKRMQNLVQGFIRRIYANSTKKMICVPSLVMFKCIDYYSDFEFFSSVNSDIMEVSTDKLSVKQMAKGRSSAYGRWKIDSSMQQYGLIFQIVKQIPHPKSGDCQNFWAGMGIGLHSNRDGFKSNNLEWYKYYAKGMSASSRGDYSIFSNGGYTTGDVVGLCLDSTSDGSNSFWNLSFVVNDKKSLFYSKISKDFDYYIVVDLYMKGDEIKIIW